MNKDEILKRIGGENFSVDALAELLAEITEEGLVIKGEFNFKDKVFKPKDHKPWRGEHAKNYFTLFSGGDIHELSDFGSCEDDYNYLTGNYFKTEQEAKAYKERQEATGRVTHRVIELNEGKEGNCMILFIDKRFISSDVIMKAPYLIPHMAGHEIANQIIEEMEDDLRIIFGQTI